MIIQGRELNYIKRDMY